MLNFKKDMDFEQLLSLIFYNVSKVPPIKVFRIIIHRLFPNDIIESILAKDATLNVSNSDQSNLDRCVR